MTESLDLSALRAALKEEGEPWIQAYTSMTALTEEERVLRLGVPPTPGLPIDELESDVRQAATRAAEATGESVGAPAVFDLRSVNGANYSTDVRDQGACGSCVAFGVAAAMEGIGRFTAGRPALPVDISEAHLYYCHGAAAGARCNTGWWPDQACNAAKNSGVAFENYFPYVAGDRACGVNADWPNHRVNITSWQYLNANPAGMKEAISSYGSVVACFDVYQDFFSYRTGVYRHVTGSYAGGHCVSLIGYDDSAGCWIGKNSWGTGWGDAGYFRIAYGQCRIETYQTIGIQGVKFRTWWPNQTVQGLWSNESDNNIWAYTSSRGWLRVDGAGVFTSQVMLQQFAAGKAGATPVGVFEDSGVAQQIYVW